VGVDGDGLSRRVPRLFASVALKRQSPAHSWA
jgi:hypothetical protein